MKLKPTPSYSAGIQLSVFDLLALLFGAEVAAGGTVIGLWRFPDIGCRCPSCVAQRKKGA